MRITAGHGGRYPKIDGDVFGKPLDEVMALQEDIEDLDVPLILVALTNAVVELGGCQQEGLFR